VDAVGGELELPLDGDADSAMALAAHIWRTKLEPDYKKSERNLKK
jgi:hypothetical protein